MVSNILFGLYEPEWTDYLKTYSSIFGWNFRKVTSPFTFHPEFPKFSVKWFSVAKGGEGKFSYEIILGATVFIHHISLKTPAPPLGVNKQSVPKLFLAQKARNLLNFSLGVRVYHNFLPWSCPVRNLPIASNTRDFPENIHVKMTFRLESPHNLMSTLQRWLQSLDPLLTRTWFRNPKLRSRHYNLSLSN